MSEATNDRIRVQVYPSAPEELVLRVLAMPEKYRRALYSATSDFAVMSEDRPEFDDNGTVLCLRGYWSGHDNDIFGYVYPSADARNRALDEFSRIIRRLNGTEDTGGMVYGVPSGPFVYCTDIAVWWVDANWGTYSRWHLPMPKRPDFTKSIPALAKRWDDPPPTRHDRTVIE